MRRTPGVGFRQILCPVDFSKHSRAALRVAAELARRGHGTLTALYISDPLLDAAAAAAAYDVRYLKTQSLTQLRRFVDRARLPVPVDVMMAPGQAAKTIGAVATRLGADLVVMGSHGLTGAHKLMLGSTTEHVLRASDVPVLVVPGRAPTGKALATWPGAKVLVAVDLVDYRAADVRALRHVLTTFGGVPVFLHVMRPVAFPSWFAARRLGRAQDTAAHAALRALAKKVGAKAQCQLLFGDPADEIAATAASARAGLVILKLRRSAHITGPRRGAITYRVAAYGTAPVLAIP